MEHDTLPPASDDAAATEYARRIAAEPDTGPLAMPGSARFDYLMRHAEEA